LINFFNYLTVKYTLLNCSVHQTHYEQFGEISGTVKISGEEDKFIRIYGARDHSYGKCTLKCFLRGLWG